MILTGAIANGAAVLTGGLLGLLLRRGMPERINRTVMQGLGLCVLYVGISGTLEGENVIVVILSVVLGAVIGSLLDFDARLQALGDFLQAKVARNGQLQGSSFSAGFVSATLVICIGAMSIVGSLQSGLSNNHATLLAKSLIDGVFILLMASTLGAGVCFSAVPVFLYEGALTLCAGALAPFLTDAVVNEMTCTGSLLIVAIALNMLKLTDIKVANFLLAPFFPILLCGFF